MNKEVEENQIPKVSEQQQKAMQKQAAVDFANYKKRLKESVEVKKMQVEELEFNIKYYEAKKKWKALQPAIKQLEEEEEKEQAEMEAKLVKQAEEKQAEQDKPKIVIAEQGVPRPK